MVKANCGLCAWKADPALKREDVEFHFGIHARRYHRLIFYSIDGTRNDLKLSDFLTFPEPETTLLNFKRADRLVDCYICESSFSSKLGNCPECGAAL